MEVIKSWLEQGVDIPDPYRRHLKIVLAPDKRNVPELTFTFAYLHPHSKTDYHRHDRPELIVVLAGRGKSVCDGSETDLAPDMALWVLKDEVHQIVNTGDEMMKLATVFVPAYRAKDLLDGIVASAERDARNKGSQESSNV